MTKQTGNDLLFAIMANILLIFPAWNINNVLTLGFVTNIHAASLSNPLTAVDFFVMAVLAVLLTFLIISLARINHTIAYFIVWILLIPMLFGGYLVFKHLVYMQGIELNPKTGDLYMLGVALPLISLVRSLIFTILSAVFFVLVYKKIKKVFMESVPRTS